MDLPRPVGGAQNADLSLTKTDSPDPVTAGETLTYTLIATNNGPNEAGGVTLTDTLPAGVTFQSASSGCTHSGGTVVCELGALASDSSATAEIRVIPQSAGTITNTASVSGSESDPATANNTASAETTVSGNRPPDCSHVGVSPKLLWPPNHKYRLITLTGATDPDGDSVTLTITGGTQDEPLNGLGDGDSSPDAKRATASNEVYVRRRAKRPR